MSSLETNHELFTESIIDSRYGTNARKLYDTSVSELIQIRDNSNLLTELLDIDSISGDMLNSLASNVGTNRLQGETDADLRKKIITTSISKYSNGTINDLVRIIKAFDAVNTYRIVENPDGDFRRWDGMTELDGYESIECKTSGTLHVERDILDTDNVNYSIADFLYAARTAGTNVVLSLFIKMTNCTDYVSPNVVTIQNTEKFDNLGILDGSKYLTQFISEYVITSYRILDINNEVIKDTIFKSRFKNGIMIYSALLREGEGNGKQIKTIEFYNGNTLNFRCILPVGIQKKQSLRILFYKENI